MSKMAKRFISATLSIMMVFSLIALPVFAVNTLEYTLTVSENTVTNEADKTVTISIDLNTAVDACSVGYTVTCPAELEIVGITAGENSNCNIATTDVSATSNQEYVVSWQQASMENVNFTNIGLVEVKVPSGTAQGEYTIEVSAIAIAADYSVNSLCTADAVSTTITVSSATAPSTGITLTAAATNDNPVRVGATNPIKVNVGVGQAYAATEMTITYPSSLVRFDQTNSTLGTNASVTDDGNGTLKLADYGEDKNAGSENYVLAFTLKSTATVGTAEFKVTAAGVGTGTSAVNKNLSAVTELGSVSIAIEAAQYTVALPTDGLFYAATTIVEAGGTFTFYPEQTTGGYYDYTLPTATYADGTSATVTATSDGTGWQIENVTGNVTINAGSRTPKNYGTITYAGTGASAVTNGTVNAVYNTDIFFTIPKDVAASTTSGVQYSVAASIGGTSYTFGNPTTDDAGNRTYTIPGAYVTGAVTITVTATTLEANKVTVSIGGNSSSDGNFENTDAGASVQVDKTTGTATLTVDTESGLNKGYNYTVSTNAGTLTKNDDGTYTITNLTSDATITIDRTINVDGVKNAVTVDSKAKSYVTLNSTSGEQMWLIQLPNNVQNTTTAVYRYNGQQMYWSADHNNYVIVVISTTAPDISADKFTLEEVSATPTIASNNWDVNKSGSVDANDAQLIWNMYKAVYTQFDTNADGATVEKFMLADANHDGILDLNDATVIINQIMGTNAG